MKSSHFSSLRNIRLRMILVPGEGGLKWKLSLSKKGNSKIKEITSKMIKIY